MNDISSDGYLSVGELEMVEWDIATFDTEQEAKEFFEFIKQEPFLHKAFFGGKFKSLNKWVVWYR